MGDAREGNVYRSGTKDLSPPCLMGAGWCFYMLDTEWVCHGVWDTHAKNLNHRYIDSGSRIWGMVRQYDIND